jgi:hypothetical protein
MEEGGSCSPHNNWYRESGGKTEILNSKIVSSTQKAAKKATELFFPMQMFIEFTIFTSASKVA